MLEANNLEISEGTAPFTPPSITKPCTTWYKIFGSLKTAKQCPLIVLHGGPGANHHIVLANKALASADRAVIVYDQLGCGNSTLLPEKASDPAFWQISLWLSELSNLISHLGLAKYDLLGHSFGGMLAAAHASARPDGLRRLILANAPPDFPTWIAAANRVRGTLSPGAQEAIAAGEASGERESEVYEAALKEFFLACACMVEEDMEDMTACETAMMKDPTVALVTCGPSEFISQGSLKDLDVTKDLGRITVPTLVISGKHDRYEDDGIAKPFVDAIASVQWESFEHSSHMASYEETDKYLRVVGAFLEKA
ncbi:prolyl aminopeptidase [Athelia psychrophila]|uniref:Prolyl aminopeptidase n=1 Tax=Athelia psychrophila TaxID=1759441 RepID=A0A166LZX0_9AGAM|nr:prolyl aminopeptidase [Fibularhizoctonia sp. CBS 109695]